MTKQEIIELIEDQLGEMRTNQVRMHFHPEIIAFTCDKNYRFLLSQAYSQDRYSIEGALSYSYQNPVYYDITTSNYFCLISEYVIPFHPVTGAVWDLWKHGDRSVKFEPYNDRFERRAWNRLSANFGNVVRYWFDKGVPDEDVSVSSVTDNTILDNYQPIVWLKDGSANKISTGDEIDLELLISFYQHGDEQEIYVPQNVGDVGALIDMTTRTLLSKIGIQPDRIGNEDNNE